MKKIQYILYSLILLSCGSDSSLDCLQNSGTIVQKEYDRDIFKKIMIFERVELIVSQGEKQSIVVETGENLLNEIKVRVEDSVLKVSNRNSCNFIRDYGITKVYVTSPNITEIRNSSSINVKSSGAPLQFPKLKLISNDEFFGDEFHNDGGFELDLDVGALNIDANGVSRFILKGKAFNASFVISDSDVRIEAGELIIQRLGIAHRGTNIMIVNPQLFIKGEIRSLGDVISKNRPPVVEVEELFRGRLIFE